MSPACGDRGAGSQALRQCLSCCHVVSYASLQCDEKNVGKKIVFPPFSLSLPSPIRLPLLFSRRRQLRPLVHQRESKFPLKATALREMLYERQWQRVPLVSWCCFLSAFVTPRQQLRMS